MDTSTDQYFGYKSPKAPKKRGLWFWFSNTVLVLFCGLVLTAIITYKTTPNIDNINECFITAMYKVDLCPKNKTYVRYGQLPKHLIGSLIAAEDASFYFHNGFDWDEIKDSLDKSMDAGRWVRGGSTLTQQLAKNLYLYKEKSLVRKFKEFYIAKQIEKKLKKTEIIEKYFNVVEFGKNIYGIHKASYYYFKKSPGALSPAEGAYLVSLLPSPVRYSSAYETRKDLSAFNKKRVVRILSLLRMEGKINDETYEYEKGRALNGLWSPIRPTEEDGVYWVNGEKKTSESTDGESENTMSPAEQLNEEPFESDESPAMSDEE